MAGEEARVPVLRTGRLEALRDGDFAIAITLLLLEISVPPDAEAHLLSALLEQWPSHLAYVVGFATLGAFWLVPVQRLRRRR